MNRRRNNQGKYNIKEKIYERFRKTKNSTVTKERVQETRSFCQHVGHVYVSALVSIFEEDTYFTASTIWEEVAKKLQLKPKDIHTIKSNDSYLGYSKIEPVLKNWVSKYGKKATIENLVCVLKELELAYIAGEMEERYDSKSEIKFEETQNSSLDSGTGWNTTSTNNFAVSFKIGASTTNFEPTSSFSNQSSSGYGSLDSTTSSSSSFLQSTIPPANNYPFGVNPVRAQPVTPAILTPAVSEPQNEFDKLAESIDKSAAINTDESMDTGVELAEDEIVIYGMQENPFLPSTWEAAAAKDMVSRYSGYELEAHKASRIARLKNVFKHGKHRPLKIKVTLPKKRIGNSKSLSPEDKLIFDYRLAQMISKMRNNPKCDKTDFDVVCKHNKK